MNASHPSFESAHERLLSVVESLHQQNETLQMEVEAGKAEAAKAQEELAIANRRGERGSDWQVLQSRIDLNQTSMNAILGGEDTTAEMRDSSEDEEPRMEAEQMLNDLHARIQEMKQRFGTR